MLSKLTLKMFGCRLLQQHCSTCCRHHHRVEVSSCAFWLKTFPPSHSRCYRFSIRWFWYAVRGAWQYIGEGGSGCFGKKYFFALKILIAFGLSILHNILFVCREFRGRIYYSVSVRRARGDMNSWIYPDGACSQCLGTILMIIFKVAASHLHII